MQPFHAVTIQLGLRDMSLQTSKTENFIMITPKCICRYYLALLSLPSMRMEKIKAQWQTNIIYVDVAIWEGVIRNQITAAISHRDKLIKLQYLNKMHYTPSILYIMGKISSSECHLFHMLGVCLLVRHFWIIITRFREEKLFLPNICTPIRVT